MSDLLIDFDEKLIRGKGGVDGGTPSRTLPRALCAYSFQRLKKGGQERGGQEKFKKKKEKIEKMKTKSSIWALF